MDHVRATNLRNRLAELDAERESILEALGEGEKPKKSRAKKSDESDES